MKEERITKEQMLKEIEEEKLRIERNRKIDKIIDTIAGIELFCGILIGMLTPIPYKLGLNMFQWFVGVMCIFVAIIITGLLFNLFQKKASIPIIPIGIAISIVRIFIYAAVVGPNNTDGGLIFLIALIDVAIGFAYLIINLIKTYFRIGKKVLPKAKKFVKDGELPDVEELLEEDGMSGFKEAYDAYKNMKNNKRK